MLTEEEKTHEVTLENIRRQYLGVPNAPGDAKVRGLLKMEQNLIEKIKIYTFTGMEICDDDELSMLENNTYLFTSLGN